MTEDEIKQAENKKKQSELVHAYKRLFATDDGKIIGADLECFCGQNRCSVAEQCPDAYQTMFAEGKRRVYLRIIGFLRKKEDG